MIAQLRNAIRDGMDHAGTLPAREAVKVRPSDWHYICDFGRLLCDRADAILSRRPADDEGLVEKVIEQTGGLGSRGTARLALSVYRAYEDERLREAREALEPFSIMAGALFAKNKNNGDIIYGFDEVTISFDDFVRARLASNKLGSKP